MKMFRLATVGASYLIHGQKIDRCFRFHAMQCSKYICNQSHFGPPNQAQGKIVSCQSSSPSVTPGVHGFPGYSQLDGSLPNTTPRG